MSQGAAPHPQADADQLEVATDQAIAACDGDSRLHSSPLLYGLLAFVLRHTVLSKGYAVRAHHGAALAIVGLPYAVSRASIRACPIPELISALPQSFEAVTEQAAR